MAAPTALSAAASAPLPAGAVLTAAEMGVVQMRGAAATVAFHQEEATLHLDPGAMGWDQGPARGPQGLMRSRCGDPEKQRPP